MDAVFIDVGLQRPEENDLGEQFMSIVRDSSSVYHKRRPLALLRFHHHFLSSFLSGRLCSTLL